MASVLHTSKWQVTRKNDLWTAKSNGMVFTGEDEESLRAKVRQHCLAIASPENDSKEPTVRLKRTWNVAVLNSQSNDEDDDYIYSLFD